MRICARVVCQVFCVAKDNTTFLYTWYLLSYLRWDCELLRVLKSTGTVTCVKNKCYILKLQSRAVAQAADRQPGWSVRTVLLAWDHSDECVWPIPCVAGHHSIFLHTFIESLKLEKTSEITNSNITPSAACPITMSLCLSFSWDGAVFFRAPGSRRKTMLVAHWFLQLLLSSVVQTIHSEGPKDLGRSGIRTADSNWPEGYSVVYDLMWEEFWRVWMFIAAFALRGSSWALVRGCNCLCSTFIFSYIYKYTYVVVSIILFSILVNGFISNKKKSFFQFSLSYLEGGSERWTSCAQPSASTTASVPYPHVS